MIQETFQNREYTIISDAVIDDLLALRLLQKLTRGRSTLVSTFGNIPQSQADRNLADFISVTDSDWSLVPGSQQPLSGEFEHEWLNSFNGADGVWGVRPTILNEDIVHPKTVIGRSEHIISLGALTDLQKVFAANRKTVQSVMIMGGAFAVPGNFSKYAECNIAYDPDAAHTFFGSCSGVDVRVVPLDVTRKVFWDHNMFNAIPETTEYNRWLKNVLLAWYNNYGQKNTSVLKLHDPLAVYLTFFPDEVTWQQMGITVVLTGEERGKTTEHPRNPRCAIAMKINDPLALAEKMFTILFEK